MTPKQLAELEIWLAAGFDLPTALAAVGPDEDETPEPAAELDSSASEITSRPEEPIAWHYFVAIAVAIILLVAVLMLNAR